MNYKQNYEDSLAIITLDDLKNMLSYQPTEEVSNEEITSALVCASVRVDELCGGQIFTDFNSLQPTTQAKVKLATCFIAQYYLSGGYSWLRGSTSLNAGQISVSQSFPDEPDYLIPAIKPLLQINEENLFKPTVSFRNNFSKTHDNFITNRTPEKNLTWNEADKMYMRPNNFQSTDKTVIIENAVPMIGEPKLNFRVRVEEINKYKSDNKTTAIDKNNVITATGVEFDGVFYSAKDIQEALIKRATYDDLSKKIDTDFNNTDLEQLISKDLLNDIKLSTNDKKLYVHIKEKPSGGGQTYYGDGKTTVIDNQNIISAIGLKLTDNNYIKADDIAEDLKQIADNKTNIHTLSGQVEEDIKNIGKNKEDISQNKEDISENVKNITQNKDDISTLKTSKLGIGELDSKSIIKSNSGKYYVRSMSKPQAQTYYGIDDIMNKDNLSDFVDSAREDNILQVEGSKLVVIAPNSKWKLVMKPEDFKWDSSKNIFNYTYPKPLKNTSQYKLYYFLNTEMYSFVGSVEIVCFKIPNYGANKTLNNITLTAGVGNVFNIQITPTTIYSEDFARLMYDNIYLSQFWIYELENAMDPLPVTVPSKPVINKKRYFEDIKLRWT